LKRAQRVKIFFEREKASLADANIILRRSQ
jgi:hypothetical protein